MGLVFSKDSWGSDRGSQCVVFLSFVLSNGTICVKKIWSHDLCGYEDFEKGGQWAQESEIRVIWPPKNLKPLYNEEDHFFVSF
jgi:hypothetical protein